MINKEVIEKEETESSCICNLSKFIIIWLLAFRHQHARVVVELGQFLDEFRSLTVVHLTIRCFHDVFFG